MSNTWVFALVRQRLAEGCPVKLNFGHGSNPKRENIKVSIQNRAVRDASRASSAIRHAIDGIEQSCNRSHVVTHFHEHTSGVTVITLHIWKRSGNWHGFPDGGSDGGFPPDYPGKSDRKPKDKQRDGPDQDDDPFQDLIPGIILPCRAQMRRSLVLTSGLSLICGALTVHAH